MVEDCLLLVADDSEQVLKTSTQFLTSVGYSFLIARDGDQALELFRATSQLRLCLLDVVMPGRTGLEVLEVIRVERPSLPVIIMSANDTFRDEALANGAAAFYRKPFGWDGLLETIQALVVNDP